eukprot:m.886712 g.886712  ORF g.886712 m.886712 type:complete len:53 (-) comp59911_c0_seq1:141-299(-)
MACGSLFAKLRSESVLRFAPCRPPRVQCTQLLNCVTRVLLLTKCSMQMVGSG